MYYIWNVIGPVNKLHSHRSSPVSPPSCFLITFALQGKSEQHKHCLSFNWVTVKNETHNKKIQKRRIPDSTVWEAGTFGLDFEKKKKRKSPSAVILGVMTQHNNAQDGWESSGVSRVISIRYQMSHLVPRDLVKY